MPAQWVVIEPKRKISPQSIIAKVCDYYNVTKTQICAKDRRTHIVTPRQIAMYMIKKHTDLYLKEISDLLGRKDHTTVIHAIKRVGNLAYTEDEYNNNLINLEQKIIWQN